MDAVNDRNIIPRFAHDEILHGDIPFSAMERNSGNDKTVSLKIMCAPDPKELLRISVWIWPRPQIPS